MVAVLLYYDVLQSKQKSILLPAILKYSHAFESLGGIFTCNLFGSRLLQLQSFGNLSVDKPKANNVKTAIM